MNNMRHDTIVLGAGMVGSAIVKDLAQEPDIRVMAADLSQKALARLEAEVSVAGMQVDFQEKGSVSSIVADYDFVISAVPGYMGFETLQGVIGAGKNVVDISYFDEDPFLLDGLAISKGVTAVVGCGVAPGLCNILAELLYDVVVNICFQKGLADISHGI